MGVEDSHFICAVGLLYAAYYDNKADFDDAVCGATAPPAGVNRYSLQQIHVCGSTSLYRFTALNLLPLNTS